MTSIPSGQFQHGAAFFTSCPSCCAVLPWAVKQLPPSTLDLDAIQGQVKIFLPSHDLSEETSGRITLRKWAASLGPISGFGPPLPVVALFFGIGHLLALLPSVTLFYAAFLKSGDGAESSGPEPWRCTKHFS